MAALVDFHKIQCFFSSTIQITALLLFQQSQSNSAKDTTTVRSNYQDFFDTSILIILASSGFIPISVTIACISRYGRQSWYLLTLTLITMTLATVTLAVSNIYALDYGIPYDIYSGNMQAPYLYNADDYNDVNTTSTTCNIKGSPGHSIYPICGSRSLKGNAIGADTVLSPWMWVLWVNCVAWLFVCIVKHGFRLRGNRIEKYYGILRTIFAKYNWTRLLSRDLRTFRAWAFLSLTTWPLCFGGQFYLFSVYFASDVISQQWTFGQIIAVTVWIPSIVEYIYMEYSESRFYLNIQPQAKVLARWSYRGFQISIPLSTEADGSIGSNPSR